MPRCARVKSFDSVYHIMVRSISDTPLYRDDCDKEKYINLIRKYQGMYSFKVYSYSLMDTHGHIIVDCVGADISKIMHSINQAYAQYFNRKYKRHGHVFQDRFKSKIVHDDRYLITLSAYIHNNAAVIKKYKDRLEKYRFSSYGIYLGIRDDIDKIVDAAFVLNQFSKNILKARQLYTQFVSMCSGKELDDDIEFRHERAEYRSERRYYARNYTPEKIIDYVSSCIGKKSSEVGIKYIKDNYDFKALCAFLMRNLCDMKQKSICSAIGGITQSHASKLCNIGYELVSDRGEYEVILKNLIKERTS